MQTQTQTTTAMPTTAELLTAYNALAGGPTPAMRKCESIANNAERISELVRLILEGDTSGKLPAKGEKIAREDCAGEYFIPAILAVKAGKLTPAQAVAPLASRDTLRPAMNCVYYDSSRAAVVATCGHVLMSFPCGPLAPASGLLHPVTLEPLKVGDVVNKQVMGKDAVDTRYPDYVNVIRLPNPNGPAATLDVQSFRNQLAGIARAGRFVNLYTGIRARIQHEGQDFYVDAALCDNVLRAMQASGTTRVNLDLSQPNRTLQFTAVEDAKKLALIMPVQGPVDWHHKTTFAYCTVLDTAVGQVLTNPAPVKRTAKVTNPIKRPGTMEAPVSTLEENQSALVSIQTFIEENPGAVYIEDARCLAQRLEQAIAEQLASTNLAPVEVTAEQPSGAAMLAAANTPQELHEAVFQLAAETHAKVAAMPELMLGSRVECFLDGAGTVLSRKGMDYWVRLDSGERVLYGRGDLSDIESHQIGQPITHAPTIVALAELVTLATAQMERDAQTSPATVANEFYPPFEFQGFTFRGFCRQLTLSENLEALRGSEHQTGDNAVLPDADSGWDYQAFYKAAAAAWAGKVDLFVVEQMPGKLFMPTSNRLLIIDAPTATPPTPPAADATALLVEHQADEYLRTCNDEQPDELIRARHGEPLAPAQPNPVNKRNPFAKLISAGDRVQILHSIGKCAVARVTPRDASGFFYACRLRQFKAYAKMREDIPLALAELRRMDRAEVAHNAEVLTYADFRRDFPGWSDANLTSFYRQHDLTPAQPYTRLKIRQAVTTARLPSRNMWLAAIQTTKPTNPAK
jgi:hypothetical protein